MKPRFVLAIASFTALVLVTASCSTAWTASGSGPQVGKAAPDFRLSGLDGKQVSLSGLRGHPVVLNFWASWCGPCRAEMPFLEEVYQKWSGKGLVVLGVNLGESTTTVANFMSANRLTFPVLLDTEGEAEQKYNIRPIPTTFFIDQEGIMQVMKIGAFPSAAAIEKELERIVQ